MVSVIIPTLNEESTIGNVLEDLMIYTQYLEIIVVDGRSCDQTSKIVGSFKSVKFIQMSPGRALQMNAGASSASTDLLWFLHADSRIDAQVLGCILKKMNGAYCSGSCYLKFDRNNFWYNMYSRVSRLNWSVFTYGDQGIFIKKSLFEEIGGYKQIPIMEDINLVMRIKRKCSFKKLDFPIVTSARRFEQNGVVKQEIKNIILVLLYLLGVSPYFLKRFY